MKEQFADRETSQMVKKLGMDESCMAYYGWGKDGHELTITALLRKNSEEPISKIRNFFVAPTLQQIEEWLWEKHKIYISLKTYHKKFYCRISNPLANTIITKQVAFPVTAKIEGIKAAVKHLHEQL